MPIFSDDLKKRILSRYDGDDGTLKAALENPDPSQALVILYQYSNVELAPGDVVEMIESGRTKDLLAMAKDIKLRQDLCVEASAQAKMIPHPWNRQGSDCCPECFEPKPCSCEQQ